MAGLKPMLNGGHVAILVSVHDVQVHGQSNTLGYTLIPLSPCGVQDGWYSLHAGSAAPDDASMTQSGSQARGMDRFCARRPLCSHAGDPSSINLWVAYEQVDMQCVESLIPGQGL